MVKGAYMAAETDEWNPNNTKLSLYTEYIGNTVNECEEYVWREMEKFRATYGDPTGKSEHFTSRFLNDGQKLKIISEMLQKWTGIRVIWRTRRMRNEAVFLRLLL